MYIYSFNDKGEYIGRSLRPIDPVKGGYANINRNVGTDIPVPAYNPLTHVPIWKGARWVLEVVKPKPHPTKPIEVSGTDEITMAQCRLALYDLHQITSDEDFLGLIELLPDEFDKVRARLEFRTRPTVRKDNPLVQAIATINEWNLDELFKYAAKQ